jgi:hypothetical protein
MGKPRFEMLVDGIIGNPGLFARRKITQADENASIYGQGQNRTADTGIFKA